MTDKKDIERLFKQHYRQLYKLAETILHDREQARDVVHDVFTALLDMPSPQECGVAYLAIAVRNRCLNNLRNLDTRARVEACLPEYDEEAEAPGRPDEELITRIHAIMDTVLTPQCRRVMELRFVDGLKFIEIAGILNISERAVYKHVRNALILIRKNLEYNG